jgi:hypothetical protein
LLVTIPLLALVGFWLWRESWEIQNVISLVVSIVWGLLFGLYGGNFITSIFPTIYADSLWLIVFVATWLGSGVVAMIPFLAKGESDRAIKIFTLWIAAGFAYTALDNMFFGPFAVGPGSYLLGQDLTRQNPSYLAEDLAFGSLLQRLGVDPFTDFAAFITYVGFSLSLLGGAVLLVGAKKVQSVLFDV